ncbi:response regulator transcription factor [bacterium]|nr:response regulator transcription factor [bacterium]
MRILLAEDDEILQDGISKALSQSGFVVEKVANGVDADTALLDSNFDLAILDLGLPQMDGMDVLRNARSRGNKLPILLLTARAGLGDRVQGLNLGADDYMPKPFDLPELEARVKALIRRSKYSADNEIIFASLKFDVVSRSISVGEDTLEFSSRELAVMECLMSRPGKLVNKEILLEKICGWDKDVTPNAIEVYVHRTRKKIEPHGVTIKAMRGLGYMLDKLEKKA